MQLNLNTTYKELITVVECLDKFSGIIFGYEINVFSDNKNMVYAATMSESQREIHWKIIIKVFGYNTQNIAGVDNIVAYKLSRLPYTSVDKDDPSTSKTQCCMNELFTIGREETDEGCFPLNLLNVLR